MNHIEITADQISPEWLSVWGENFGAPQAGKLIGDDNRVSHRLVKRLCDIAGVDVNQPLSPDAERSIHVYINMREKLIKLCGLIFQGDVLKHLVMQADFELLSSQFSEDEMRFAVQQTDLHQSMSEHSIDMENMSKLVEYLGDDCIRGWLRQLDEQTFLKLNLFTQELPKAADHGELINPETASSIVNRACMFLVEDNLGGILK